MNEYKLKKAKKVLKGAARQCDLIEKEGQRESPNGHYAEGCLHGAYAMLNALAFPHETERIYTEVMGGEREVVRATIGAIKEDLVKLL